MEQGEFVCKRYRCKMLRKGIKRKRSDRILVGLSCILLLAGMRLPVFGEIINEPIYGIDLPRWIFQEAEEGYVVMKWEDEQYGLVNLECPRFMMDWPDSRVIEEMMIYRKQGDIWSERVLLEILYYSLTYGVDHDPDPHDHDTRGEKGLEGAQHWLDDDVDICDWQGITCGDRTPPPYGTHRVDYKIMKRYNLDWGYPARIAWVQNDNVDTTGRVTKIDLPGMELDGTLPHELHFMKYLYRLNLRKNYLRGTIPPEYGDFPIMSFMDLSQNALTGTIPIELTHLRHRLEELWLGENMLTGPIPPELSYLQWCHALDLSSNKLTGPIPNSIWYMKHLDALFLQSNKLKGKIPLELVKLSRLLFLDLGGNDLTGPVPPEIQELDKLMYLHLDENFLTGTIPTELFSMTRLESVRLMTNRLRGRIPVGTKGSSNRHTGTNDPSRGWANLGRLSCLTLDENRLTGTLSSQFILEVSECVEMLGFSSNKLRGAIPTEIASMKRLESMEASSNQLSGTIPTELAQLETIATVLLNFTNNKLEGPVPQVVCDAMFGDGDDMLFKDFGCDAFLCPSGTYHPEGAASNAGGCRPCFLGPGGYNFLGRQTCPIFGERYVYGDVNGDGELSPREILRLIFVRTMGHKWGEKFQPWYDMDEHECDLVGVTCVGWEVARIDLSEADLCAGKEGPDSACQGIPEAIGGLSNSLEVLSIERRRSLWGTMPTEIGLLTKLRFLSWAASHPSFGILPSEIGNLSNLRVLNLSNSRIGGTLPTELFKLKYLEKLNLSTTMIKGQLPSEFGNLAYLRECIMSRMYLTGSLPTEIANLAAIENFEVYGNSLTGPLPSEIGLWSTLKRVDAFNNQLSGTLPEALARITPLQILHLKRNAFTGTIPASLGTLAHLTWIDLSMNVLSGTIPASLGTARSLKDLRLGGNRLHTPIPNSLCNNNVINNGRTLEFGCAAILCPVASVHDYGFATEGMPCTPCETPATTMYLGGTECVVLSMSEILSVFFDVMRGQEWDEKSKENWGKLDEHYCDWGGILCDPDTQDVISVDIPATLSL